MSRFLFVVPPLSGHVNPTLSLGKALLLGGHEVAWLSVDANLEKLLPVGGVFFCITHKELDVNKNEHEAYQNQISSKNVTGIESVRFLYEEVLIPLNRYMYEHINSCVGSFNPDVIINDQQLFSGAIVAKQQQIKYATSVTAPAAIKMQQDLPGVSAWEDNQIIKLQYELGLAMETSVACSNDLTLVYTSLDFFGEMELNGNYKFIGLSTLNRPTAFDFNWEYFHAMPYAHKILVSIGTTFDHSFKRDFFSKVIEAFGNQDLGVVVVSDPSLFDQWPSNFMVSKKIPQLDLLPFFDAVICHGGHNTVCETLNNGIPLVVIPIAYDQSYVAGRVVATGAGLRLNYRRFKAHHLLSSLQSVLFESNYRLAAQKLRRSFEQAGGVGYAVRLLEDLALNNIYNNKNTI
ncbi:glycosyltransferase [Olivibacter domesticus]|uniref:Glycosyltransferase, MGT family n=1 Tax=Olivibacter domesticus TaxID=407022 RepID=A0A1H7IZL0_OLID1|nr:nucleotide disphospho-sugar-binding domain-containing protein [Olivibacter domesticus]SEK67943.1 glycosyltransferase, MGT family [Olivibacter domesticus]